MRFSDKSLVRLSRYLKVSEPVDPSWEEEYGDVETFDQPEGEYRGLTEEEFIRGEVSMALMGYDVENMNKDTVLDVLISRQDILKLFPKYNLSGIWIHSIKQTRVAELEKVARSVSRKSEEICVTDANAAPFWEFSEYRRFGLVFEGPCKVMWNADMYSYSPGGVVRSLGKMIDHIDSMTEGWITPSECKLVGIRVKEDENLFRDLEQIKNVCDRNGWEFNNYNYFEKVLTGVELVGVDEVYDQGSCEVGADLDSPEHLYEEVEEGVTYSEKYNSLLDEGINESNLEKVKVAIEYGADYVGSEALYKASAAGHEEIVKLLLDYGVDPNSDDALRSASLSGFFSIVKLLLDYGADPNTQDALVGASEGNFSEIVKLLLDHGVNPNKDKALYSASHKGFVEIVKLLLDYGADPNTQDALYWASTNKHAGVVKLLLMSGASIDKVKYDYARNGILSFIKKNNLEKYVRQ